MANLELEGKIKTVLPAQGGTSARGTWARQDFVIEYQDGSYPAEVCFSAWGQDKIDELARCKVGDTIKVSFNIRAREYSGRWYNDLRVWRISAIQQNLPSGNVPPQAPYSDAPAPSIDDMPGDFSNDDLPF